MITTSTDRLIPFDETVFAYEPELLSKSYLHFDNIISKFGPANGKYLAALPGSVSYRKRIVNELKNLLGEQSNKYMKVRAKLLPQGGQKSPYFYTYDNLSLNETDFIDAAIYLKSIGLIHHITSFNGNAQTHRYDDGEFDPAEYKTNEITIKTKVGNQQDAIINLCRLLGPVIGIHDELNYADPFFNPTQKNEYVELWRAIFGLCKGKKEINIHTQKDSSKSDYQKAFGDYLNSGVIINVHIYEEDRINHDRFLYGKHGGWTIGRGIQLSKKDEIILKFTAIGSENEDDSRISYLGALKMLNKFTIESNKNHNL